MIGSTGLHHALLLYDSEAEFRSAVAAFADEGAAAGEPVLVAAPTPRLEALRAALNRSADAVTFVDAHGVGANPARLIPAYRRFIEEHPGRRLRLTGELMWPGARRARSLRSPGMRPWSIWPSTGCRSRSSASTTQAP